MASKSRAKRSVIIGVATAFVLLVLLYSTMTTHGPSAPSALSMQATTQELRANQAAAEAAHQAARVELRNDNAAMIAAKDATILNLRTEKEAADKTIAQLQRDAKAQPKVRASQNEASKGKGGTTAVDQPSDPAATWCQDVAQEHNIRPGSDWGSMSDPAMQAKWQRLNCNGKTQDRSSASHYKTVLQRTAQEGHFAPWDSPPAGLPPPTADSLLAASCSSQDAATLISSGIPAALLPHGLRVFSSCARLAEAVGRISKPVQVEMIFGLVQTQLRDSTEERAESMGDFQSNDHYNLLALVETHPQLLDQTSSKDRRIEVLVDAGANVGDLALCAARLYPALQVLAFEPSPETYLVALWNLMAAGIPILEMEDLGVKGKFGVVMVLGALAEHGDPQGLKFYHNPENSQISSLAKPGHALPAGWTEHTIPTFNLISTLTKASVPMILMFKIDCEGCEFGIFGGSLGTWLGDKEKVLHIESEIHWHLGCPRQYNDPVAHVSKEEVDGLYRPLERRGCPNIAHYRKKGEEWQGRGDACQDLSC